MRLFPSSLACCFTFLAVGLAGCTGESTTRPAPDAHAGYNHGDLHPKEGPHHGDLIELGNEELHAELLHDGQTVTVYILNGAADEQFPIEASEITINTKRNGSPVQFRLAALPDENDPSGESSRFVSNEPKLAGHIDGSGADARLVLTIAGKSYHGSIKHDHEDDHGD